ncbi:MAG: hypothetical protein V7K48_25185 [Nostoc sp.]
MPLSNSVIRQSVMSAMSLPRRYLPDHRAMASPTPEANALPMFY